MAKGKVNIEKIVNEFNQWEAAAIIYLDRESGRAWLEKGVYLREIRKGRHNKPSVIELYIKEFDPEHDVQFTTTVNCITEERSRMMKEYAEYCSRKRKREIK